MIDALVDLHAYQSSHGLSDASFVSTFDVDSDHIVSNADLQALLGKINSGNGSIASVPEPAMPTLTIAGCICSIIFMAMNRHRA